MIQQENRVEAQSKQDILKGALAGFVGTVPMTIFMMVTQRFLPKGQHYDLPPELITKDIAHKAHVRWQMSKGMILVATLAAHFGYGATMGAVYAPIEKRIPLPAPLQGVLFGILIWAASYFALLPLLGIAETGKRESLQRNLMMLVAHLVWGSTMGAMVGLFTSGQGEQP